MRVHRRNVECTWRTNRFTCMYSSVYLVCGNNTQSFRNGLNCFMHEHMGHVSILTQTYMYNRAWATSRLWLIFPLIPYLKHH